MIFEPCIHSNTQFSMFRIQILIPTWAKDKAIREIFVIFIRNSLSFLSHVKMHVSNSWEEVKDANRGVTEILTEQLLCQPFSQLNSYDYKDNRQGCFQISFSEAFSKRLLLKITIGRMGMPFEGQLRALLKWQHRDKVISERSVSPFSVTQIQ